jgi:hypothetical protein
VSEKFQRLFQIAADNDLSTLREEMMKLEISELRLFIRAGFNLKEIAELVYDYKGGDFAR